MKKESVHSEIERKQNIKKKQHTFEKRRILVTKSYTESFVESS